MGFRTARNRIKASPRLEEGRRDGRGRPPRDAMITGGAAVSMAVVGLAIALAGPARFELTGAGADRLILPLAIVAAAFIPCLAVIRPWWGLEAWILAIPLFNVSRVRLETTPVVITMATVVVTALAVGMVLARHRPRIARNEPIGIALFALVVGIGLTAAVASPAIDASLPIAVHGVVEPAAIALIVVGLRPSPTQLLQLLLAVGIAVAGAAAFSMYRMSHIATTLVEAQTLRTQFGAEVFYNVNIFGVMIVAALPLVIACLALRRDAGISPRGSIVVAAIVALLAFALYLTFSKGAWLGGLAGVGLLLAWQSRSLARRAAVIAVTFALSMLVVPLPLYVASFAASTCIATSPQPPRATHDQTSPLCGAVDAYGGALSTIQGSNRLSSWDPSTTAGEVSVRERLLAWRAAVRMTITRPILGVGPGRYGAEAAAEFHEPDATRALISAHNFFLNLAAEFGIPFVLLIVGTITAAVLAGRRMRQGGDGPLRPIGLGGACSLVGFVVVASTTGIDTYQAYRIMNSDMILLGILVGLTAAGSRLTPPADQVRDSVGRMTATQ